MDDGYWDKSAKTVIICTDNFTLAEVELLIAILKSKFNLTATVKRRINPTKKYVGELDLVVKRIIY